MLNNVFKLSSIVIHRVNGANDKCMLYLDLHHRKCVSGLARFGLQFYDLCVNNTGRKTQMWHNICNHFYCMG